jgi:hypothetical protein
MSNDESQQTEWETEVVCFRPSAPHRHRLEVIEGAVSLLDDLDQEVPFIVDVPAELVAGLNVETTTKIRRDRDHPPVADLGFLRSFFSCHAQGSGSARYGSMAL